MITYRLKTFRSSINLSFSSRRYIQSQLYIYDVHKRGNKNSNQQCPTFNKERESCKPDSFFSRWSHSAISKNASTIAINSNTPSINGQNRYNVQTRGDRLRYFSIAGRCFLWVVGGALNPVSNIIKQY